MTHWYGWLLLATVASAAVHDGYAIVANAWRGYVVSQPVLWFAVWTTLAVALVVA